MKGNRGFTLAEIIIVVAILSIIAGIVLFNITVAAKKSRDGDRQADLRTLQSAVELYKQKYGRYPARCATQNPSAVWSGQIGTSYACSGGDTQYIVGLAPEFIPTLPVDKRLNGVNSGYVYTTNNTGTVYKIMAKRSVESETVSYTHPFKSCDVDNTASTNPICNTTAPTNNKPNHCFENNVDFSTTYAVWGGFANGGDALAVEQLTEDILCDVP
jgi:prepilin-type N-terminal cleavage/methylation domain-containing protein